MELIGELGSTDTINIGGVGVSVMAGMKVKVGVRSEKLGVEVRVEVRVEVIVEEAVQVGETV